MRYILKYRDFTVIKDFTCLYNLRKFFQKLNAKTSFSTNQNHKDLLNNLWGPLDPRNYNFAKNPLLLLG